MFGLQNVLAILKLPAPNLLPLAIGLTGAIWLVKLSWNQTRWVKSTAMGKLS